jgi:hypothetical protein
MLHAFISHRAAKYQQKVSFCFCSPHLLYVYHGPLVLKVQCDTWDNFWGKKCIIYTCYCSAVNLMAVTSLIRGIDI